MFICLHYTNISAYASTQAHVDATVHTHTYIRMYVCNSSICTCHVRVYNHTCVHNNTSSQTRLLARLLGVELSEEPGEVLS